MKVTVFHNIARDKGGRRVSFDGYAPRAPMVRVFEYDHPGDQTPERIAEDAYYLFNVDPHEMQPADREIAGRYRARNMRSLSVGDVVMVGETAFAVERIGFDPVRCDAFNEVHETDHGTVPLHRPNSERGNR